MSDDTDPDPFTAALRQDLPSSHDEARVRARLATAGVLAGVGVVAPTAAATTGAATTGMLAKALALPLAGKLGVAAVLVVAVAVPVVRAKMRSHETASTPATTAGKGAPPRTAAAMQTVVAHAVPTAPPTVSTSEPMGAVAAPATATAVAGAAPLVASRASRVRDTGAATVAPVSAARASLPAVGSFPVEAAPEDEGTLRAETALMEHALAALKGGDLVTAKQKLAEHAKTFPNGHLAPERDRALERIREKETLR